MFATYKQKLQESWENTSRRLELISIEIWNGTFSAALCNFFNGPAINQMQGDKSQTDKPIEKLSWGKCVRANIV